MKSPAYQWYPKDILSSQRVAMMDAKVECWYRRALDYCWVNGNVPSDPKKLAAMIGKGCTSKTAAQEIIPMFSIHPDDASLLIHDRQEVERVKQAEWSRKSANGGRKSAQKRAELVQPPFNQNPTTLAPLVEPWLPNGTNQKATLQFTSSISSTEEVIKKNSAGAEIEIFDDEESPPINPNRPFNAPPWVDVKSYFLRMNEPTYAEAFFRYHEGAGWVDRYGRAIAYWPSLVAGWISRDKEMGITKKAKEEKAVARNQNQKHHVQQADRQAIKDKYG